VRHSSVFLPLFAPFGISSGYVGVTLAFLLGRAGLSTLEITTIIAATLWAQTWKVLWAPIIDTVGNPRLWYGLGAAAVGATILAMSLLPMTAHEVPLITLLAVISSAASTLVSMSSEIFMAQGVPAAMHGRASGWAQAGNLGGAGVGGGLGLLLAEHVSRPWVSGAVLAAICLACWGCVWLVPAARRSRSSHSYLGELRGVVRDVWAVARSRAGYLALILMILPIASGAAPWSAIAGEWGAGADLVALVNGVVGGLASAAGALVGGYVCDRLSPAVLRVRPDRRPDRSRDGLVGALSRSVRGVHAGLFGADRLWVRGVFGDRAASHRPAVGRHQFQHDGGRLQRADRADDDLRRLGP
jgi:MFS family permease